MLLETFLISPTMGLLGLHLPSVLLRLTGKHSKPSSHQQLCLLAASPHRDSSLSCIFKQGETMVFNGKKGCGEDLQKEAAGRGADWGQHLCDRLICREVRGEKC